MREGSFDSASFGTPGTAGESSPSPQDVDLESRCFRRPSGKAPKLRSQGGWAMRRYSVWLRVLLYFRRLLASFFSAVPAGGARSTCRRGVPTSGGPRPVRGGRALRAVLEVENLGRAGGDLCRRGPGRGPHPLERAGSEVRGRVRTGHPVGPHLGEGQRPRLIARIRVARTRARRTTRAPEAALPRGSARKRHALSDNPRPPMGHYQAWLKLPQGR